MVEINNLFQVNTLEAWQGSYGTGAGYLATPHHKKDEDEEKPSDSQKRRRSKGITQDDSGVVHVDLIA